VSSAAVAEVGGVRTVYFGSGQTMYALRADTGELRWKHDVGTGQPNDFTEIESSPLVVEGKVVFGIDVHNHVGQRAGLMALDANSGNQLWYFDPDGPEAPSGCVDMWGSPSADLSRRMLYIGTGSCADTSNWRRYTEAIVAVGLDDGKPAWSYQPHQPSPADLDFAGAPNLFEAGGKALVGLGGKDGNYYALDRDSGKVVWEVKAAEASANGGFIGSTAVADGVVAGGTGFPGSGGGGSALSKQNLHGLDAATGRILWQRQDVAPTYGSAAAVNGVLFVGASDFTMRAVDLHSGQILWSQPVKGVVAGGSAIVGDSVYSVAGIREPGLDKRSETSGVYAFGFPKAGEAATTTTAAPTTTAPRVGNLRLANAAGSQRCIGSPCPLPFNLKAPPAGLSPTGTLEVMPDPFSVTIRTEGLGGPQQWVEGGPAATEGATVFGLFISESDDNPVGGLLCILDANGACTADTLPRLAPYNRITLLALRDADSPPKGAADGVPRLMTTISFDPPLTPEKRG
jgi:outer membrane protein assembly factor BamB